MKKTIIIILSVVGVIAGYILINSTDEVKDSTLTEPVVSKPTAKTDRRLTQKAIGLHDSAPLANGSIRAQLAEAMKIEGRAERILAFAELKKLITPENWMEALAYFDEIPFGTNAYNKTRGWRITLIRDIGDKVGRDAMLYFYKLHKPMDASACIKGWSMSDSTAAINWLETEIDLKFRDNLWSSAMEGIARSDPYYLSDILIQFPLDERAQYTKYVMSHMIIINGFETAEASFNQMVDLAHENNEPASKYLEVMFNDLANRKMSEFYKLKDGKIKAAEWLTDHLGQSYASHTLVNRAAHHLAKEDPEAAREWLSNIHADHPERDLAGYYHLMQSWISKDGQDAVAEWLNDNPDDPQYQILIDRFVRNIKDRDPRTAYEMASRITDDELREQRLKELRDITTIYE